MDTLTPDPTRRVVEQLITSGLVDPMQQVRAQEIVSGALGASYDVGEGVGARRGLSSLVEVVAYLGGALVLAAVGLFVGQLWGDLDVSAQVVLLVVAAAALAAGAVGAVLGHRREVAASEPAVDVRRRLAGTLVTAAALALAVAAGLLVDQAGGTPAWDARAVDLTLLTAALVGLAVAVAGYGLAPTIVGLLGIFWSLCAAVSTVSGPVPEASDGPVLAVALGLLAVVWLVLAERGVLGGSEVPRVLGLGLALWAAQTPVVLEPSWFGYLLTALLAVAATTVYLRTRAWPYLAVAVISVTVLVPEAVTDWTDGGIGVIGAVLLTGVTLLGASLVGAGLRARAGAPA